VTQTRATGFTLLEVLAALVVIGLIVILLAHSVDFAVGSWQRQASELTAHNELEPVDRALRRLIEQMDPGDPGWPAVFECGAHSLLFATQLPDVPAGEAEVALGTDGAHRLVLTWRSRLEWPAVQHESVLLEGVERLDIQYWQPEAGVWLDNWSLHNLPALVRLRVVFRNGDRRQMPSLIAGPMRARPNS
jgi:general secretion pathway protein J